MSLSSGEKVLRLYLEEGRTVKILNEEYSIGKGTITYWLLSAYGTSAENNTNGGIITSPVTFLRNTVGNNTDTYSATKRVLITGVGNQLLSDLEENANCCTLTSLYNIMVYYRDVKKYSKIPTTLSGLYKKIRTQATNLGYTPNGGIGLTKNNNLVTNTWRDGFGYTSGEGSNNYLWTNTPTSYVACLTSITAP